jgi:apolipoprotein N-acyltransferase
VESSRIWKGVSSWVALAAGSVCFVFVGWRFNVPLASWIAPIFLIRFFRDRPRWVSTLPAIPLLAAASYIQMAGGWDLDAWMIPLFSMLRPAAFLVALYADRALVRRLPKGLATLVYPSAFLAVDYAMSFTPLGTILSASATQFSLPVITQLASVTGLWGIGFLAGWTAAVANLLWESRPQGGQSRLDLSTAGRTVPVLAAVLALVAVFGSLRVSLARPASPTVRVAGIAIEHPRDYWDWIDEATPRATVAEYAGELAGIQERLFVSSARAVSAGAKVVFWSEGNCVLTEDTEAAFVERAGRFAKDNGVYLAASVLVLRYGQTISDNKVIMLTPEGTPAFTYVKTMSWYPTGSDGILRTVDTPYGRIGTAVCFDMDFPYFINRFARMGTDIVLVPSFDSERIRPYHTEVGLMRGVENGFSMVRQVSSGSSMAADPWGRLLGQQDYFHTADRLMIVDVPTRGTRTLYGILGDWFAWAGAALAVLLVVLGIARPAGKKAD